MARSQPPQQPPPVQKLRVHYVKRDLARYASHRDFGRALERALRRAQVPMAYSSGFSPHPRISYAGAAPTGTGSEAEYLELGLSQHCDPDKVRAALNQVLPAGFEIKRVIEATGRPLAERMAASWWTIELPGAAEAAAELAQLLAASTRVEVSRQTKKGERRFDVRAAVVRCWSEAGAVQVIIAHGEPLVRPDDVVAALFELAPDLLDTLAAPRATRLAQGPLVGDQVGDPFTEHLSDATMLRHPLMRKV